jgi:hypothetical protein
MLVIEKHGVRGMENRERRIENRHSRRHFAKRRGVRHASASNRGDEETRLEFLVFDQYPPAAKIEPKTLLAEARAADALLLLVPLSEQWVRPAKLLSLVVLNRRQWDSSDGEHVAQDGSALVQPCASS